MTNSHTTEGNSVKRFFEISEKSQDFWVNNCSDNVIMSEIINLKY